ncbi:lysine--tRNA ligase [Zavarzinia aquatilis]|uniref:Lysine--tRNA ligase n=1 Tax=Zavarzinia aquatilis TaxID=2211142 RepID=A0A317E7Q7_9PROT|nr:lysine--tRNA ligase [Zavarzinia aquatilis]PWR21125.1 lysine--tRNA ligase [Zavarzinia aquatilis]
MSSEIRTLAQNARAWPFEEARKLLARIEKKPEVLDKGYILFETGYGPSGLPHIGTFGEVSRTTMVRHAFNVLTDGKIPSKLLCFSDDMDGMRKVPDNVPNPELLRANLGKPLTRVPDPFGKFDSFGHHNNAMLRSFLDRFGFEYEFASASDYYAEGKLDDMLLHMLARYDEVMAIMLPTLRSERQETYAPFLPVHPKTGVVMQVPIEGRDVAKGLIRWTDPETKETFETPVTGGGCKAQWKPDWALRWAALGVDYEMSGKDHIDNVKTSSKICRVLGGLPPDGFNYELFLDDKGQKISKSKGNGLTIEEWLTYASPESLSLFMYAQPKTAKRLYFDVIPRQVDDYFDHLAAYPAQEPAKQLENPVYHIHSGNPPAVKLPITFGLLLNLAGVVASEDKSVLWGFIGRYAPGATPESLPVLDDMVGHAIAYFRDYEKPHRKFRLPTELEAAALSELAAWLESGPADQSAEALQTEVFEIGKRHAFPSLRDWFKACYEVLFGEAQGPRMGSFIALFGVANSAKLIRRGLAGELLQPATAA